MSVRMRYPELEEHYELQETLGSGGFAKVKAGIHKLTGEKVAVKIMDKHLLGADLPRVYREIHALKQLHHQHICQLFQVIETHRMIYMILEFCSGGELFDYIVAKERLREKESRSFFRQIVAALHYVHDMGFIHRDLKPENLLLDDDSNIKLIDFGLVAEPNDTQDLLQTCCGSPAYAAPELIRGGPYVGTKADVWSLGVLLYALLNGFLPFDDDHTPYLYRLIQRGEYDIPEWLKPGSIAIIACLLQTDPDRRIKVESLLCHEWVMQGYNEPVEWRSKMELRQLDADCVAELARYYQNTENAMREEILQWKYDHVTAAYFLLLQQKLSGKIPHILHPPKKRSSQSSVGSDHTSSSTLSPLENSISSVHNGELNSIGKESSAKKPSGIMFEVPSATRKEGSPKTKFSSSDEDAFGSAGSGEESSPELSPRQNGNRATPPRPIPPRLQINENIPETPPTPVPRHRRLSLGQPIHPPIGEIHSLQKPPMIHPAIIHLRDEDIQEPYVPQRPQRPRIGSVPIPSHLAVTTQLSVPSDFSLPPTSHIPTSTTMTFPRELSSPPQRETVKKTRSYDSRLYRAVLEDNPVARPLTPQFKRRQRGRLGSIGDLVKKVKKVFHKNEPTLGPRRVKAVYDVASTSMKPSNVVVEEIERVLTQLNITYKRKHYNLRCQVPSYKEDAKIKMVEFDLEVCLLPGVDMIGVRRKRLRGDTWEYKRMCDQIFKATRL